MFRCGFLAFVLLPFVSSIVTDSYVDAYKEVHGINQRKVPNVISNRFEPYDGYPDGQSYQPEGSYASGPSYDYGAPKPDYGPSKPVYGPPKPAYGPPIYNNYIPVYNGPLQETPHALLGLLDKFKFKIDLFTIGKIILKIVLFKKIVSFIAILCLLLFLPSLKHQPNKDEESEETDEGSSSIMMLRSYGNDEVDRKINNLAIFVLDGISKYQKMNASRKMDKCDYEGFCYKDKILEDIDKQMSYTKLSLLYLKDLKQ